MLLPQMTYQVGHLCKLLRAKLAVMCQPTFHFNICQNQVNPSNGQLFNNVCITIPCPGSSRIKLRAMTVDDMLSKRLLTVMHRSTMCTGHLILQTVSGRCPIMTRKRMKGCQVCFLLCSVCSNKLAKKASEV